MRRGHEGFGQGGGRGSRRGLARTAIQAHRVVLGRRGRPFERLDFVQEEYVRVVLEKRVVIAHFVLFELTGVLGRRRLVATPGSLEFAGRRQGRKLLRIL